MHRFPPRSARLSLPEAALSGTGAAAAALVLGALALPTAAQVDYTPGPKLVGAGGELFAQHLASAGDFDADGFTDLIVTGVGNGSGEFARIHSGATGLVLHEVYGIGNHPWLGNPTAGVGDVNGDGHDDLLVGDGLANRALLVSGADGSVLRTFQGDLPGDQLGGTVGGAGDVNADGVPDLMVGTMGVSTTGYVRVYSGLDGSQLHEVTGAPLAPIQLASLAGIGDVDLDGHDDFATGSTGDGALVLNPGFPPFVPPFTTVDASGVVRVFSGADGHELWKAVGDVEYLGFGFRVRGAGDVDGDGVPDLIAGTLAIEDAPMQGYARVLSGVDGSSLHTLVAPEAGASFVDVDGLGDVDGDGRADLLVAYRGEDALGVPGLRVRVFSGADGSTLYEHDPDGAEFAQLVSAVALDDVNADSRTDFAAGLPENFFGGGFVRILESVTPTLPEVHVLGCGVNPPASLTVLAGAPKLGTSLTLGLDDPTGGLVGPALPLLALATQPAPGAPCGLLLPGFGLGGPGAPGELLIDPAPPNPFLILVGPSWTGAPTPIAIALPHALALAGAELFVQGVLVDATGHAGLTEGQRLVLGNL